MPLLPHTCSQLLRSSAPNFQLVHLILYLLHILEMPYLQVHKLQIFMRNFCLLVFGLLLTN